ncbi:MAG: fumarate hydratase [Promethearchaeota archaeon]
MVDLKKTIIDAIVQCLRLAATHARKDVMEKIAHAMSIEESDVAREQLSWMVKNMELGIKQSLPYCQDTGSIHLFIKLGDDFPVRSDLESIVEAAIVKATTLVPLRPNTVDPVSERNLGGNGGPCLPDLDISLVGGDELEIDVLLKGGGSENMSLIHMVNPLRGWDDIVPLVEQMVVDAGGKPCPPVILGIGIGGTASTCMKIAKKSLLRPLGTHNDDEKIRDLEERILKHTNQTGIGTMGLGGTTTVLAVHVESCPRHPASFPVGVVFQCYAHRHAHVTIRANGDWKVRDDFA